MASLVNTNKTLLMVLAISLHNLPEGISVACPIYAATGSKSSAIWWATLSGLSELVGSILAVCFLGPYLTAAGLDYSLMCVGGVMVAVSAKELLPQAWHLHKLLCVVGVLCGSGLMTIGLLAIE